MKSRNTCLLKLFSWSNPNSQTLPNRAKPAKNVQKRPKMPQNAAKNQNCQKNKENARPKRPIFLKAIPPRGCSAPAPATAAAAHAAAAADAAADTQPAEAGISSRIWRRDS